MPEILQIVSTGSIVIVTCILMSLTFSFLYAAIVTPILLALLKIIEKYINEQYHEITSTVLALIVKPLCYYLACIWPAFIISWLILPHENNPSWWLYGFALWAFCTSPLANGATLFAFILFCIKPQFMLWIYGWVPFI